MLCYFLLVIFLSNCLPNHQISFCKLHVFFQDVYLWSGALCLQCFVLGTCWRTNACVCVCVCLSVCLFVYVCVRCCFSYVCSLVTHSAHLLSRFEYFREITHFSITLHYFGITNLRGYQYKFASTCSSSKAPVCLHADFASFTVPTKCIMILLSNIACQRYECLRSQLI